MTVQERILEIKKKLRLNMNGVASTSMREAGIGYKLNFGVGVPGLKQIASETGKDAQLAAALWKEGISEQIFYLTVSRMREITDFWYNGDGNTSN